MKFVIQSFHVVQACCNYVDYEHFGGRSFHNILCECKSHFDHELCILFFSNVAY
jgi:hypothetical protein